LEVVRRRSCSNHISLPEVGLLWNRPSRGDPRESEEEKEGGDGRVHLGTRRVQRRGQEGDGGREREVFEEEGKKGCGGGEEQKEGLLLRPKPAKS